jgi:hypothetical protein
VLLVSADITLHVGVCIVGLYVDLPAICIIRGA